MNAEEFANYLKTPEARIANEKYFTNLKIKQYIYNHRIERFHEKYGEKLDLVIEKLLEKYNSDSYRKKEFKQGYEPRETLLWFVYDYAQNYCQPCLDKTYFNSFTVEAFYVGSYVFSLMLGQGSALIVEKQKNINVTNIRQAIDYMLKRAVQLLRFNIKLTNIEIKDWGLDCSFIHTSSNQKYQSIYLLPSFQNKGLYKTLVREHIITSDQCNIEVYLIKKSIPYTSVKINHSPEYETIVNYYGDKKAKRSNIPYINHIEEGLAILEWIGASDEAKRAFCLHPIYQMDDELTLNADKFYIDSDILLRTIEYRSVANEYLSYKNIQNVDEIRLSPIKDVNDMLIADKIQNRKDFELYHENSHPRSNELKHYFNNWMQRLNISEDMYQNCKKRLTLDYEIK
jgi:hypothetical protein